MYSDMDRLVIERWTDVVGLIEAHRSTQDRIEEMIDAVGERIARWARPLGYDTETSSKDAEFRAWRPEWADKRRGPRVTLAVGGFCPLGFRKIEEPYPYLWVKIDNLANFKMKDAERMAFSNALRAALGEQARSWEADGVDDTDFPLGRFLTALSNSERARLIADADVLFAFATENFAPLFEIADVIDGELRKLGR